MGNKNNKAFTLIELLSVVVLLGVIALIATPIITNSITDSKKKSYKISSEEIIKVADMYYARYANDASKRVSLNGSTNLLDDLELKGDKPDSGTVYINKRGKIAMAVRYGDFCYMKTFMSDELHTSYYTENTCQIELLIDKDTLIDSIVTSGDGLYYDALDNSYRYKGANPNNYIRLFDGDMGIFRIIAIEEQGIKVMRNQSTRQVWDNGNVAVASCTSETCPRYTSDSSYYCSNAHKLVEGVDTYIGCNAWYNVGGNYTNGSISGIVNKDSSMLTYLKEYYEINLTELSNKIVQNAIWNIGTATSLGLETQLLYERSITWQGKIGLMSVSDYVRSQLPTSSSTSCTNQYGITCKDDNWIHTIGSQWMTNIYGAGNAYIVYANGSVGAVGTSMSLGTRPVVYLKSTTTFNDGNGTLNDPYIILN